MTNQRLDRPELLGRHSDTGSRLTTALPKLAAPARRALDGAGINALEDLAERSEAEIAALHGMGPSALATLKAEMAEHGLSFANG